MSTTVLPSQSDIVPSRRPRRAVPAPAKAPARAARTSSPHVLSEELFKGCLIRHRNRVDRSNGPLVVMLVTLNHPVVDATLVWTPTIETVAGAMRETDVLGWFERHAVLGVILTDLDAFDGARRRELENRLRRAVGARLDGKVVPSLDIHFYVHTSAAGVQVEGLLPAEPLLVRLRPQTRRSRLYGRIKRALDLAGSLALLVALAPLLLLIALAVKLTSPGPVFFRQVRVGQMMRPFTILKFRTMSDTADHAVHHEFVSRFIQAGAAQQPTGASPVFKITNDPRVTRVGRLLRKTSLDELPQLWNVLRGEMSLVGPRPPIPYEVAQYKTWHCRRVLEAKPGITGLWQVTGRSRTTFDEMVRLDIRYARTRSLSNDLKILLATPAAVIAGKGAC
jgi:lipopolysaccharide/colanic/teichoic acid biosynthesis glycosyltransferase